ncbi:hypothetical protein IAT38_003171 [Cryptococcus sp. DSM 104549]
MNQPAPLSHLTDPISIGKVQILLVPIHLPSAHISTTIFDSYCALIRKHHALRGDEIFRPLSSARSRSHSPAPGGAQGGWDGAHGNPRLRFFPPATGTSISLSRTASGHHVHLAYARSPPSRHTYPSSLLRMAGFPLIVVGIAVDQRVAGNGDDEGSKGYSLNEEGDVGEASTPTAPTFRMNEIPSRVPADPEQVFEDTIRDVFPHTSPFPLVKRLVVVPNQMPHAPSSPRKQGSAHAPGVGYEGGMGDGQPGRDKGEMKFAPEEGVENWITRLLGEVVGDLLGEFGEMASALETPAGMKTLSSTLLPSLTATMPSSGRGFGYTSDYPSRASVSTPSSLIQSSSQSDTTASTNLGLARSLTPGGRPASVQSPSLPPIQTALSPSAPQAIQSASSNPFRRSVISSSPFSRTSSAASATSSSSPSPAPSVGQGVSKYTSASLAGMAGGRLLKLLGDMYLLAGMYVDAIKCYDEGAERCRAVGDALWEGVAREGRAVAGVGEAWEGRDGSNLAQPFPTSPIPVEILSHYLSALACLSRAPLPYPPTILSPAPQAVSGSLTFPAPASTNPANVGTGEGLLAFLYSSLSLRISHFMLLIWAAGGWGSIALSSLMGHTLPRSFPLPLIQPHDVHNATSRRRHARGLRLLSAQSQISRQAIFAHAERAIAPHHRAMTKMEQLGMNNEVVWLARWLGLPRKESAVTREVIKQLAGLVVDGRYEAGGSARQLPGAWSSMDAPQSGGPPPDLASVGLGLGMPVRTQAVGIRRKESTEGNAGIVALFERAADVLGIDLLPHASSLAHQTSSHFSGAEARVHPEDVRFGWPEIQVEMMKQGISVMEALPDPPAIVRLCLSALHSLSDYINPQTQLGLAKMYPSALATVRRRGLEFGKVPWWIPGQVVMSLEVAGLPSNKTPVQHSRDEISATDGKKDPFLYNPRLKAAEGGKTIMVANEQVEVFVTIQNPFSFSLEIQDISILTTGVPFTTLPMSLAIPASSVQTVRLCGTALTPGDMEFRGVHILLADGSSADVLLPILDATERQRSEKLQSRAKRDSGKVKRTGLDARLALEKRGKARDSAHEMVDVKEKWLEGVVVEELPLAWIKSTSLTHGVMMLYNGERSAIRITIENSSSVPINFLKLSFEDSTMREAQAIIAEGDLTPEQAYEIEWDQINQPVFTWENEGKAAGEATHIAPGGRATLLVRCLGKAGCADGTIRIDYGCVGQRLRQSTPSVESALDRPTTSTFYTRQITFPVLFTVYHTIECHSLTLTRLRTSSHHTAPSNGAILGTSSDDALRDAINMENDEVHCLLGVSVRNVYGVPFEVTLERRSGKALGFDMVPLRCTRLVPPGATERIIVPLPRRSLSHEHLSRPIPALSERQYVVDKEKKSLGRVAAEREVFWYREELLGMLTATWSEPGSLRRGTLGLRDQFFSPSLLEVFRADGVNIHLSLSTRSALRKGAVRPMDYVDFVVEVVNHLDHSFRPHIRLEPLASSSTDQTWSDASTVPSAPSVPCIHPHKNVLFDGLTSVPLPVLPPGERAEYRVSGTFVAAGEYGFRAAVEEVDGGSATGGEGSKLWFSPVLYVQVP